MAEQPQRPSFVWRHLKAIWALARVLLWLAGRTPRPVGRAVAECASLGLRRITQNTCRANMRACFPDWTDARRAALFASHQRYMVRLRLEAARLLRGPEGEMRRVIRLHGEEHVRAALALGRGVLVVGRHEGTWWHAPAGLAVAGHSVRSVFNSFPLQGIEEYLVRWAGRRGVRLSLVDRGAAEAMRSACRDNAVFYVSVDVPVRGQGASLYAMGPVLVPLERGPAILARRLRMPIVPVTCVQAEGRISDVTFGPPDEASSDPDETCRRWAAALQARLTDRPEQWWAWGFTDLKKNPGAPPQE